MLVPDKPFLPSVILHSNVLDPFVSYKESGMF